MTIWGYITIAYFVIGIVLTYIWWYNEYNSEYNLEREEEGVEEPMAVLLLAGLTLFWPIKLIKNYFESFIF
jgi:hypothetical protein